MGRSTDKGVDGSSPSEGFLFRLLSRRFSFRADAGRLFRHPRSVHWRPRVELASNASKSLIVCSQPSRVVDAEVPACGVGMTSAGSPSRTAPHVRLDFRHCHAITSASSETL